jgi:hypothetical protein
MEHPISKLPVGEDEEKICPVIALDLDDIILNMKKS